MEKTLSILLRLAFIIPLYFSFVSILNAKPATSNTQGPPDLKSIKSNISPHEKRRILSTINVPLDFNTIQKAIDASKNGDTIKIASGIYKETLIIKEKNLTLQGEGDNSTTINGLNFNQTPAILIENSLLNINGITVQNGVTGILIKNSDNVNITETTISNNKFAGMDIDNSTINISDSKISNTQNFKESGGSGIQINNSKITLSEVQITNNTEAGLSVKNSSGVISQNTLTNNNSWGLNIENSSNIDITENLINSNGLSETIGSGAIVLNSDHISFRKNSIHNNSDTGVLITNSSLVDVSENSIDGNRSFGIAVVSSNGIDIKNNEIKNTITSDPFGFSGTFGDGMGIVESSVNAIGNSMIFNDQNGINILDPVSIVNIVDNNITENNNSGVVCGFSNRLTGCCNIIDENMVSNTESGCPKNLTLCPCPLGNQDDTLSIEPSSLLLTSIGKETQLTAILQSTDEATINITDRSDWVSENNSIAVIKKNGVVTATGNGETKICATFNNTTGCIQTTVNTIHADVNQWSTSPESEAVGIIRDIVIDPFNSDVIYAATVSGKVFKSSDRGKTWIDKSLGIADRGLFALAISPKNGKTLFTGGSQSIYRSTDRGDTWLAVKKNVKVTALIINPIETDIVYAGTTGSGVLKTVNGGDVWTRVDTKLQLKNIREDSFVINPKDPDILYAATETDDGKGEGIFKSLDGGVNWQRANTGLFTEVQGVAIDSLNPETLYAGTFNKGVFKTVNSGRRWAVLPNSPHEQNRTLSINNLDGSVIYVGNQGQGIFMSRDAGTSWIRLNTQLTSRTIRAISIDPVDNTTLYAGTLRGVSRFTHAFGEITAMPNTDGTSIDISYIFNQNAVNNASGLNIYRSTSLNGDYNKITSKPLDPKSNFYNDTDFLEGSTHVYRMSAINSEGETLKGYTASTKPLLTSNPDFIIEAVAFEKDLIVGNDVSFPINISSLDNFSEEILLTASNVPDGSLVEFIPQKGVAPFAVKFQVTSTNKILLGRHEIDIIASGGNKTESTIVVLHVIGIDSTNSILIQDVNAGEIKVGNSVEIRGSLFPALEGENIRISSTTPDGLINEESTTTDKNGEYSIVKVVDKSGSWKVKSSWAGDDLFSKTESIEEEIQVEQAVTSIIIATDADQNTKQGDELTISGRVVPSPGKDNILLEIDNINGSLNFNSIITLTDEGDFKHKFKVAGGETGQIRIKTRFDGNSDFNGSEKEIFVPVQESTGMAIIVAGGGNSSDNSLWEAANSLCNYVYSVLKNQGISDSGLINDKNNRIFYLHPNNENDADNDNSADTDAAPTISNFQKAIEEWALNIIKEDTKELPVKTPLTIYMVGTGSNGIFHINEEEDLTSNDLDKWLDNLFISINELFPDKKLDSLPVNVVIESPESGSFIKNLEVGSNGIGKGRIVITSTDECTIDDEGCETGAINITGNGSLSFSKQFFFGIKVGKSVGTSWAEANLTIRQLFDNQKPSIEGNSNRIPNEIEDEFIGTQIFINQNRFSKNIDDSRISTSTDEDKTTIIDPQLFVIDQRPTIKGFQKNSVIKNSTNATLWIVADDPDNNINEAQAILFQPKSKVPELLNLQFSENNNRFELNYNNFNLFGLYKVIFSANDSFGNASIPATTFINSQNIIPAIIKGVVINRDNQELIESAMIEIEDLNIATETNKDGEYFIQVPAGVYNLAAEKSGFDKMNIKDLRIIDSELPIVQNFELIPVGFSSEKGSIHGIVTNEDGVSINNVKLKLTGKRVKQHGFTIEDGSYKFADLDPGIYNISFRKFGFTSVTESEIEVKKGENVTANIILNEKALNREE